MDKILVVVFDSEQKAVDGCDVLRSLHNDGSITLYAMAVIAKNAQGEASIKQGPDPGPLGSVVGLVAGGLIGLIGGPVGMTVGAGIGAMGGVLSDMWVLGVGEDFLEDVERQLQPGKSAVVAEVWEDWVIPVDTKIERAGGTVIRRTLSEVRHAVIERESDAFEAEISDLKAEYEKATGDAKAKVQAKLNAAKIHLQATQGRAKAALDNGKQAADAKIKSLQEQAAQARGEAKANIEARLAKVRTEYKRRTDKLSQAWELTKQALTV